MAREPNEDSEELLVEVCWHNFVNEMTQAEIARMLHVTRLRINQAIQRAKALGLVKIQIESPFTTRISLQENLKDQMGITHAVVTPAARDSYDFHHPVGSALAGHLIERLRVAHWKSFGVSWGLTLAKDVSSENADAVAAGKVMLANAVKVVRDVGSDKLGGILYSARTKHNCQPMQDGWKNAVDAVAKTGNNHVRRHMGTFHTQMEEADLGAAIRLPGDKIGCFHFGDSNRGYPGDGTIQWDPVFGALVEIGYVRNRRRRSVVSLRDLARHEHRQRPACRPHQTVHRTEMGRDRTQLRNQHARLRLGSVA